MSHDPTLLIFEHVAELLAQTYGPRGASARQWAWVGYAVYASTVVLGIALLGRVLWVAAREERRAARGQCLHCGYDLRGTPHADRCPECGAAVLPRS